MKPLTVPQVPEEWTFQAGYWQCGYIAFCRADPKSERYQGEAWLGGFTTAYHDAWNEANRARDRWACRLLARLANRAVHRPDRNAP